MIFLPKKKKFKTKKMIDLGKTFNLCPNSTND